MDNEVRDYLDRDALLQYSVYTINKRLEADGCSIFLLDPKSMKYILAESTVLTENVGTDEIDMEEKRRQFKEKGDKNIGLTYTALKNKCLLSIPDVKSDRRWNGYQGKQQSRLNYHCELDFEDLGSLLVVPLFAGNDCFGVIRVVSKMKNYFTKEKEEYFLGISELLSQRLYNAISFSQLVDTGATLSLEDFCQKVVEDAKKLTNGKGCTIFLADEDEASKDTSTFRAIASTGLYDGQRTYSKEEGNLREACYRIINDDKKKPISITEYSIKNKVQVVINDVYSKDELNRFPTLQRDVGHGQYREYLSRDNPESIVAGAIIYSPIFSRDKNEVLALIRINKPRVIGMKDGRKVNTNKFNSYERRLFSSYVDKLAQILINIRFISTIDRILTLPNKEELYSFSVKNVVKIIGGRGCSILIINKDSKLLEYVASEGVLRDRIKELRPYQIGEGWTGWVAAHNRSLMFNRRSELDTRGYEDMPRHSGRFHECETGGKNSEKFIAVPICGKDGDTLGVIRAPKLEKDSDFTDVDTMMLQSLAKHVGLAIENIESFERQTAYLRKANNLIEIIKLLQEQEDEKQFFKIFLTGLTHGDAIGFNRAMLFRLNFSNYQLSGMMSIGPLNKREAEIMKDEMAKHRAFFTIQKCIEAIHENINLFDDELNQKILSLDTILEEESSLFDDKKIVFQLETLIKTQVFSVRITHFTILLIQ